MSIADEIERLNKLRKQGALSDEEFQLAKGLVLGPPRRPSWGENIRLVLGLSGLPEEEIARNWAVHLHLSQFLGYLLPILGMAVPLLIWRGKRGEFPSLDPHGRAVMNWIVTSLVGWGVVSVLAWLWIGIPLVYVWGVLCAVFPLYGAYQASRGRVWTYPLSLRVFAGDPA